ncbi:glycosyltransferase family 9 protein [Flavobacterium branchiicola]|uniref:Glycosyltransferase family 9 protein n=1 Tax=Flavobacterium branchiicola TaxID=1114875 RepID=A0ABV9PB47_9FLAO|nr:glycosyltransferase family 9 protein [Flavobacterium branchiicola]MBS7252596.1 glycosyltransferase family 9 protein [Flavobacterium branchiicola]
MNVSSKINSFRRAVMNLLTRNIGKSKVDQNIVLLNKSEIKRVLVCRPNGRLGNLLLITPLLQEITSTFPNCKIDLFVKGTLAPIIFENYENVDKIIDLPKKPFKSLLEYIKVWFVIKNGKYDLAINVDQNSSSGRLAVKVANAKYKFFGDFPDGQMDLKADYEHIAKYPVYNFRNYLTTLGIEKSNRIIAPVDLKLNSAELTGGKIALDQLVPNSKKTICIFTYATGAKCLEENWWEVFYKDLKRKYKDYNIIEILPVENVSQIGFEAPSFYSKNIREIAALIANTELFIGADSGIMHLASSSQTPTAGLFSVSNLKKYEPYDNSSIGIDIYNYSKNDYFKVFNSILNNGRLHIYSKAV